MHSEPHPAEPSETSVWSGLLNKAETCLPLPGGHSPMRFRWIPPGEFVMGARGLSEAEEPRHRVVIPSGFWLGRNAVTELQFDSIVRAFAPRLANLIGPLKHGFQGRPRWWQPRRLVSWAAAQAWCNAWNVFLKNQGRYVGRAGLPSEAQWEYACRAGTKTAYWFGSDEAESPWPARHIDWYRLHARTTKSLARDGLCNQAGLVAMGSGVGEWCADEFSYAYRARSDGWRAVAPWAGKSPILSPERWRVVRGMTGEEGAHCRSAERFASPEDGEDWCIGFRVCLERDPSCTAASSDAEDSSWEDAKLPATPSTSSALGVTLPASSRQREQA